MLRVILGSVLALMICVALILAGEFKGTYQGTKKGDKGRVMVVKTDDGKEVEIVRDKGTKYIDAEGNPIKGKDLKEHLKKGVKVTVKTEKEGDKEVATEVKIEK